MTTPSGNPAVSAHRVLVVDDNADAANSLAMLLQRLRQDVRTAYNGADALAEADHFGPQVVFLDLGLPDLGGYEVARRLRTRPALKGALLVALTGFGEEETRQRAEDAGFDRHLVKPVELEVIQGLLAQVRPSR
jgi:two-component system CheB/CheR fusion protein